MHRNICLAAAVLLGAVGVARAQDTQRSKDGKAPDPKSVEKIKELIKQLGDDSYAVREKASADLVALGQPALPLLRAATRDSDLEVVRRAQACIERIGPTAEETAAAERARQLKSAEEMAAAERERQLRSAYVGARYAAIMDATRRSSLMRRPGHPN